ncbi:hypothetical protein QJQ45_023262, partial [Haematococcus lacustris]
FTPPELMMRRSLLQTSATSTSATSTSAPPRPSSRTIPNSRSLISAFYNTADHADNLYLPKRIVLLAFPLTLQAARHQLAHASTPASPSTLPISEASEDQAVAAPSPAADPAAAGAATSPTTASSSDASTPPGQLFEDEEYTYTAPATFTFVDIPIPKIERGPAPERSPLRSRFEAGDGGQASLAVVVRNAQTLSFSLLQVRCALLGSGPAWQVGDLSVWGTPEEAAKLLLPRGSVLLNSSQQQVEVPPRTTPLGPVALPPKSYYRYEFISAGQHVAVSAAATRGKVYVCGGSTPQEQWKKYGYALQQAVETFRVKEEFGIGRK